MMPTEVSQIRSAESDAASLVGDIRGRVASAMNINPNLVNVDHHEASASGLVRQCWGSAGGTNFFAKILLVDPYPVIPRFATPWDELAIPEKPERPVKDQVAIEWKMAQEMLCIVGARNIPALLGRSVKDRILVFEKVDGSRLDRLVKWGRPQSRKVKSVETAMFHAGKWLKMVHTSSFLRYETINIEEIYAALHRVIQSKGIESTRHADLALRALEIAAGDLKAHTPLRVPLALNHGDFSLP